MLVVVGIGSRSARDDAVGLALVEALSQKERLCGRVETLLWGDADALTVAHDLMSLAAPVLIVDCAEMRLPSGEWRLFSSAAVESATFQSSVSTHGFGLREALSLARALGLDQTVHIFGIQPFDVGPGLELSQSMAAALPRLLAALEERVEALLAIRPGEAR